MSEATAPMVPPQPVTFLRGIPLELPTLPGYQINASAWHFLTAIQGDKTFFVGEGQGGYWLLHMPQGHAEVSMGWVFIPEVESLLAKIEKLETKKHTIEKTAARDADAQGGAGDRSEDGRAIMSGAEAYQIWERAVASVDDFRVQAAKGLPQGYDRFSAGTDVLAALKSALVAAVTTDEAGQLGVISRDLSLLQKETFVVGLPGPFEMAFADLRFTQPEGSDV